jgi:hypothetical protein
MRKSEKTKTEVVGQIYQTTDYSRFKFIGSNRDVNDPTREKALDRLEKSITTLGQLSPIIVDRDGNIYDGQGRFTMQKKAGLPVKYIIYDHLTHDHMMAVNNTSVNWKNNNYLKSYAERGYPSYIRLKEQMVRHGDRLKISVSVMCEIFGGSSGQRTIDFNEGNYKFTNLQQGLKIISYIDQLRDVYEASITLTLVRALKDLSKNPKFEIERLVSKIEKHGIDKFQGSKEDVLRQMEDVYNWRVRRNSDKYLRLY